MTEEELNIKIKVRPVEEQRDYLLEQNMLLTGKIATLEKENAELNKKLFQAETDYDKLHWERNDILAERNKAKELLERLLITSCNSDVLNLLPNCSEVLRVRVEAEQFLKDSEVEK